jgi:hypothetical protein
MKTPNQVKLAPKELNLLLINFPGHQMARVIKGIHDNPGILTHDVSGSFYCNNVSDIRQKAASRLMRYGLKLICYPQIKPNPLTKSHRWYLCLIGEVELLEVGTAANDEVIRCAK